jgi:hypothetical protein
MNHIESGRKRVLYGACVKRLRDPTRNLRSLDIICPDADFVSSKENFRAFAQTPTSRQKKNMEIQNNQGTNRNGKYCQRGRRWAGMGLASFLPRFLGRKLKNKKIHQNLHKIKII